MMMPKSDQDLLTQIRPLVVAAIAVAIFASIMRVLVQAGRLMDDGWAGMFDLEIIAISLEGPLGQSTYVRMMGLVLLLAALFYSPMRKPSILLGAFMVAVSFALTGHATREPQWLLGGLITFHLLAVSFWFGALWPLYRLAHPSKDPRHAAMIAERFGTQAIIIVPLLIMAGLSFSWLLLGDFWVLVTSNYGLVLLAKVSLVAIVLAFAALNKLRLVPSLAQARAGAALRFRRSLLWEGAVFLLIFATTALLTTSFTVPMPNSM